MITEAQWSHAKRVVRRTIRTSLHCSIATTNPDGSPHVTPIGSLLLTDKGSALYFDVLNSRLAANLEHDARVAIVAVDSGKRLWLRAMLGGRFASCPGIRLIGSVGPPRESTPDEAGRFQRVVGPLLRTPGGKALWGSLPTVRDVTVDRIQNLNLGPMTHPLNNHP